jgi:TRAP-type uncharacterized transport system substrate-binding protein
VSVRTKLAKFAWKWAAPLAGVAALALAFFFYFYSPGDKRYHLRITAGNKIGMRHQLGLNLQNEVAHHHCALEFFPSVGSEQALDWVDTRKVDLALVQGALSPVGRPNVRQVATLHVEPMHLLVKRELFAAAASSLTALRTRTVDLEAVGSGTHALATAILSFAGLEPRDRDPAQGYIAFSLDRQHLFEETDFGRLPDAVFLVSTPPSPTVAYLVTRHGYRLVPLPFAEAFAMRSLASVAKDGEEGAAGEPIVMGRVQATTIPAFTYGVEPSVPEKPMATLGTRLLLVAHKDVHPRAVYQLIEATYAADFGQIVHPPLDAKLMELPPEFPWHAGALLYQRRNAPLLSGDVMDSAHKGFAIFAAAASGLFVLWQWLKQRGQLVRDKGFNKYISQMTRIEEQVMQSERGRPLSLEQLLALREQVCRLKAQALDRFAEGELAGKELLGGFLVHVNDVRDYLTCVIRRHEDRRKEQMINGDRPAV